MEKIKPTKIAIEEALRNPNGWVYVLDKSFEGIKDVPPEAIKGAWKVDENGQIIGGFMPNPNYKNLKEL